MGTITKLNGVPNISGDQPQTISIYLSFIGVMLTAVTVIITAVTIGIGVIAAYTFTGLKNEARFTAQTVAQEISQSTAKEVAAEALSEIKIKSIVEAYLAGFVRQDEQKREWGLDPNENSEEL